MVPRVATIIDNLEYKQMVFNFSIITAWIFVSILTYKSMFTIKLWIFRQSKADDLFIHLSLSLSSIVWHTLLHTYVVLYSHYTCVVPKMKEEKRDWVPCLVPYIRVVRASLYSSNILEACQAKGKLRKARFVSVSNKTKAHFICNIPKI